MIFRHGICVNPLTPSIREFKPFREPGYAITTQRSDDLYTKSYLCYVTVMQYFILKFLGGC